MDRLHEVEGKLLPAGRQSNEDHRYLQEFRLYILVMMEQEGVEDHRLWVVGRCLDSRALSNLLG